MSKKDIKYRCKECGYESFIKIGKCPNCGSWDSFEEIGQTKKTFDKFDNIDFKLKEIKPEDYSRISTGFTELDEILGGGLMKGSLTLISGEPGIGKTTLLFQIALNIAKEKKVLYVSGEESVLQISSRIKRLIKEIPENLFFIYENDIQNILDVIDNIKPDVFIIDSIQVIKTENIDSSSGSPSQVRYIMDVITNLIKENNITGLIVGHITKEGDIAGPKMLEHIVDTVMYLEGERYQLYRILRCKKNRFGSTQDLAIFTMEEEGLKEVKNPSTLFLTKRDKEIPGSIVVPVIETGQKPLLVEVQTLVIPTYYPQPKRVSVGIDFTRVSIMIAILEKHLKTQLFKYDIFVNVTGGIKIEERSSDLPLIISIYSSINNIAVSNFISFGEVGLGGEIRAVSLMKKRVNESIKLGFKKFIVPNLLKNELQLNKEVDFIYLNNIRELKDLFLKKGV
ncbi:MAG TPA: DNA repair protein RadA [Caldisericia bacterium]|nr:DNA repair protein RadA [Caldisericia bacterium]